MKPIKLLFLPLAAVLFWACQNPAGPPTPTKADTQPPAEVSALHLTPTATDLKLEWTDPADPDLAYILISQNGRIPVSVKPGQQAWTAKGQTSGLFTIKTVDRKGNMSNGIPADGLPAGEVTNLTAAAASQTLRLDWSDPLDADFAQVEISAFPSVAVAKIAKGVKTATFTGLTNGQTYTFTLRTRDAGGNLSPGTTIAAAPVAEQQTDTTPPGPVTALTATSGDGQLALQWTNPADSDFKEVVLTRQPGNISLTLPAGTVSYLASSLTNGTAYTFALQTRDLTGNTSSPAVTVTATPQAAPDIIPPGPVTGLTAVAGDGQVQLAWTDPTDADFKEVVLTWTGHPAEVLIAKGTKAWLITGLANGTTLAFSLKTRDLTGNTSTQAVTAAATPLPTPDTTPPGPVTAVTATPGDTTALIRWTDPADSDLKEVVATWTGHPAEVTVAKGLASLTLTGLTNGTAVTVALKTRDFSGNTTATAVNVTVTPVATPVFTPVIGPYLTLINPAPAGTLYAKVLDPATSMVVNYELENEPSTFQAKIWYRVAGTSAWTIQAEDETAPLPAGFGKIHHLTLTGLTPDTSYEYRVTSPYGEASKPYTFRTAKTVMDYAHFLVIGDMQDEQGKQRWQEVADAITAAHLNEFDFIITVGDMVKDDQTWNNDRFYWWKVFFGKGRELFARKPMLPTMGNHDTPGNPNVHTLAMYPNDTMKEDYWSNAEDTRSFRKYFYLDLDMSKPDYYSFTYGNARFLAVNSEIPVFYGRYPERDAAGTKAGQDNWIKSQLELNKASTWSFLYSHVPHINPAGGKDEVVFMRPQVDWFGGKLDWSLTGHTHQHQRLKPTQATATSLTSVASYGRGANQGVGYLITLPAGQWPRIGMKDVDQLAYFPNYNGSPTYEIGFSIIQLDGTVFSLKSYGMGDTEIPTRNPAGYNDTKTKRLIDSLTYDKAQNSLYKSNFASVDFRGSPNTWGLTPMKLVADNTWQVTVTVAATDTQKAFKFFTAATNTWYGDSNADGKAYSNEATNMAFTGGAGTYLVTFNDATNAYTAVKQ